MSYKHLTTFERSRIELLHQQGFSARQIGKAIGRHHGTISRELKRNTEKSYYAEHAQQKYIARRAKSKPHGKYSRDLAQLIESALHSTWSPEQISNTLTKKLTKEQQELFVSTYAEHLASVENKERWEAVSVTWEGNYLRVTFRNGEWLHYTKSGVGIHAIYRQSYTAKRLVQ